MKKRNYLLVGAVVLILLFSTSGSLALIKQNRAAELEVTTDKTVYGIGELVIIFLTNVGDETLSAGGPIITIYNQENEVIYEEGCYCWWEIEPGEYITWNWSQEDQNGDQVPAGRYVIQGYLSSGGIEYIDDTTIFILDYEPPDPPYGPTEGMINVEYEFCIDLPDIEECEPYFVMWDFGDGTTSSWCGPYPAGETVCINHLWLEEGVYEIRVRIRDGCGDYWTDSLVITISDNNPPSAPDIDGPSWGKAGVAYTFSFTSTDPDGDDIAEYIVDWGDGNTETLTGPFESGQSVTAAHTWPAIGDFTIRAKAKDIHGVYGPEGTMPIPIQRSRTINSLLFKFLENHPYLFLTLKYLLGF